MTGILPFCRIVKNITPIVHISISIQCSTPVNRSPKLLPDHDIQRQFISNCSAIFQIIPNQRSALLVIRFIIYTSVRKGGRLNIFFRSLTKIIAAYRGDIGTLFCYFNPLYKLTSRLTIPFKSVCVDSLCVFCCSCKILKSNSRTSELP